MVSPRRFSFSMRLVPPDFTNRAGEPSLKPPTELETPSSVFLRHYLIGGLTLRMLSATTLREIRSWNKAEETGGAWTSGKYFAKVGTDKNLYVRGFDTPWRAIADLSHCRGGWGTAATKFINEDSLIVSGCDPVRLIRV